MKSDTGSLNGALSANQRGSVWPCGLTMGSARHLGVEPMRAIERWVPDRSERADLR